MSISLMTMIPAGILIALGIFVIAVQVYGLFKLKYVLNRIHAAAMGDSLGFFLIFLGLMLIYGVSMNTAKLFFVLLIFWCSSPVSSHLIGKLEAETYDKLSEECEIMTDDGHFEKEKETDHG